MFISALGTRHLLHMKTKQKLVATSFVREGLDQILKSRVDVKSSGACRRALSIRQFRFTSTAWRRHGGVTCDVEELVTSTVHHVNVGFLVPRC